MIISSAKYDVQTTSRSVFHIKMTMVIRHLQRDDAGSYRCVAKNSLGEVESNIRLYGEKLLTMNNIKGFSGIISHMCRSNEENGNFEPNFTIFSTIMTNTPGFCENEILGNDSP